MEKIEQARKTIDSVDAQMRELFIKRMEAVKQVSEYKCEHGLPVYDEEREKQVIERNASFVDDLIMRKYYIDFLENNMAVSRNYQEKLKRGMKVAFSGVYGAFAHIAARKIYGNVNLVPCEDFISAYEAVESGECESAVLPIENSIVGEVGAVLDLLFSRNLCVTGVYDLYVHQHLMALPEADENSIKKVISHPQALSQCAPYLRKKGYETEEFGNTAQAAKFVSESLNPSLAAIASEETAELYGLKIIARDINDSEINTTRFATVSKVRCVNTSSKSCHSLLMFTVANQAGALAQAINIIGKHGFNMRCLRSRPMKKLLWNYYFYVEIEGNIDTENGKRMMTELKDCCDKIRNLGTFEFPNELHG